MYCRNCGEEIEGDSSYCKHCGAPMEREPIPTFRSYVRSRLNLFWAVAIVLALVVMVSTFVDYYRKPEAEPEPTYQEQVADLSQSVLLVNVYDRDKNLLKTGSGFVMFNDETLVTNFHVIKDAHSIEAMDNSDALFLIDGVCQYDMMRDVAILHFSSPSGLPVLQSGNSDNVVIGDNVTAIGSPLGLKNTVSKGIISAIREEKDGDIFQTTAPISSGSSGGALFNDSGEVVGITSAGYDDGQNLNLAVPVKDAVQLYEETKGNVISFVDFNAKIPIINDRNRDAVELLLKTYHKDLASDEGQKTATSYFRSLVRISDADRCEVICIEDPYAKEEWDKYWDRFLWNKPAIKPQVDVDNVFFIKCSETVNPEEIKQGALLQAAEIDGKYPDTRTIRIIDRVGDYVYSVMCQEEDLKFYEQLVEVLTS